MLSRPNAYRLNAARVSVHPWARAISTAPRAALSRREGGVRGPRAVSIASIHRRGVAEVAKLQLMGYAYIKP